MTGSGRRESRKDRRIRRRLEDSLDFAEPAVYHIYLDLEKSKFFNSNYATLEGGVERVELEGDEPTSGAKAPLVSLLNRGDRCFVSVRKGLNALFHSLITDEIAKQREQLGKPFTTGWMRHELYGLVIKIRVPIGGPKFDVKKLQQNTRGIRCLDFQGEFQGICDLSNTTETDAPSGSAPLISAQNKDILTIQQSDLQDRLTRHLHFAEWLIQTFGKEFLSRGSGVLDVAGGNGRLAKALLQEGIPCIIVDPLVLCSESPKLHILRQALNGAGEALTSPDNPHSELIKNTSIIVGLHPDEATEAVVDMAMRLGKPFAVSPCCVVTKLFPNRVNPKTGDPVRTFWDLSRYLLDKAPVGNPFEVDFLPFAGQNKVIFSRNPITMYCREIKVSK